MTAIDALLKADVKCAACRSKNLTADWRTCLEMWTPHGLLSHDNRPRQAIYAKSGPWCRRSIPPACSSASAFSIRRTTRMRRTIEAWINSRRRHKTARVIGSFRRAAAACLAMLKLPRPDVQLTVKTWRGQKTGQIDWSTHRLVASSAAS